MREFLTLTRKWLMQLYSFEKFYSAVIFAPFLCLMERPVVRRIRAKTAKRRRREVYCTRTQLECASVEVCKCASNAEVGCRCAQCAGKCNTRTQSLSESRIIGIKGLHGFSA